MHLSTTRLVLRDFESHDVASLAEYHADPRYLEYYDAPPDTERIVADARAWAREAPRRNYQLVISFIPADVAIGSVGLRQRGCPDGEAEVGFEVHPKHWGQGYGSEALSELLRFGSDDLKIVRFSAVSGARNARAHRALEALDFVNSGPVSGGLRFVLERPGAA